MILTQRPGLAGSCGGEGTEGGVAGSQRAEDNFGDRVGAMCRLIAVLIGSRTSSAGPPLEFGKLTVIDATTIEARARRSLLTLARAFDVGAMPFR